MLAKPPPTSYCIMSGYETVFFCKIYEYNITKTTLAYVYTVINIQARVFMCNTPNTFQIQ